MIAQSIHHDWHISNGVHSMKNVSGIPIRNGFAESGSKPILTGNPKYAACETSDAFKQYLEGIRHLARKKQRRCISQELR